jgi:glycosyltransferase involved in cell wall biosynthesis
MRILVLSKRQYTNKDLIDDCYGRVFELPANLCRQGHTVKGLTLSYRVKEQNITKYEFDDAGLTWQSVNLRRGILPQLYLYLKIVEELILTFKPDAIWATSDALHSIFAVYLQNKYKLPCVVDLYDNYESFTITQIPGLRKLYRRALQQATALSCVTKSLADNIVTERPIAIIGNGVDRTLFYPQQKTQCREALSLPADALVIGTAGALSAGRDIGLLFEAFLQLSSLQDNVYLLLAGTLDPDVSIPAHPNVIYLGELEYSKIPAVYNAMDICVICNKASAFGDFCFPQKLYEILACRRPLVVANTRGIAPLFSAFQDHVYTPGDLQSLLDALQYQITNPGVPGIAVSTWETQAEKLGELLVSVSGTS